MSTEPMERRKFVCTKCGKEEIELLFGIGIPKWTPLREFLTDKKVNGFDFHLLCPKCVQELCNWLETK